MSYESIDLYLYMKLLYIWGNIICRVCKRRLIRDYWHATAKVYQIVQNVLWMNWWSVISEIIIHPRKLYRRLQTSITARLLDMSDVAPCHLIGTGIHSYTVFGTYSVRASTCTCTRKFWTWENQTNTELTRGRNSKRNAAFLILSKGRRTGGRTLSLSLPHCFLPPAVPPAASTVAAAVPICLSAASISISPQLFPQLPLR